MCLYIKTGVRRDKKKQEYLKNNKPNAKGYIIGYKIFRKSEITDQLYSPYRENMVNRGVNKSDRFSKALTVTEQCVKHIEHGCHFFLTQDGAKSALVTTDGCIIRKIYFKPEDLVAIGKFSDWYDSGVVMQYKLY